MRQQFVPYLEKADARVGVLTLEQRRGGRLAVSRCRLREVGPAARGLFVQLMEQKGQRRSAGGAIGFDKRGPASPRHGSTRGVRSS